MLFSAFFVLANAIDLFFRLLSLFIIVRIFMSWLAPHSHGAFANFVRSVSDPILRIFQRLPLRIGMLDLSPLVALLVIDFVRDLLLALLFRTF